MKTTFFKDGSPLQMDREYYSHNIGEITIYPVSVSDRGTYKCQFDDGAESESRQMKVEADKRQVTLTADRTIIPPGGSVTLTCSVEDPAGLKYQWFRQTSDTSGKTSLQTENRDDSHTVISVGGRYTCRGWRHEPTFLTPGSDPVTIQETVSNRASLTLQPNWPQIFSGETITLRCEIQGGGDTQWTYEWKPDKLNIPPRHSEYRINSATESHSGEYRCKGRKDSYSSTEWSNVIRLNVSPNKPKPTLIAHNTIIPVGGTVTLTCSVRGSPDWKYYWFKHTSDSSEAQLIRDGVPDRVISVSQGGLYHCRGGRGDPLFFTENSDKVTIQETISNRASFTLQPNWPQIFSGETITLRCEIQGGGDTQWTYEWKPDKLNIPPTHSEYRINSATESHSGRYRCKGRKDSYSSTEWSNVIRLNVSRKLDCLLFILKMSWSGIEM
uniref:Ig-like domain-containing protein n=2 Tax=Dicentrarchus labrax TaxID=13489 RepID=A0A8P4GJ86_DICLA